MRRWIGLAAVAAAAVGVGAYVGYKVVTDEELRERILDMVDEVRLATHERVSGMSEEVAARRAQVTRNPKVNQDWVEQQWESVGY